MYFSDNELIVLYYLLAYVHFGNNNFSVALRWINKINNSFQPNVREDIQINSRILNLIIHFEKENYELLLYELKSTHRFLLKKEKNTIFETTILNQENSLDRKSVI